MRDRFTRVLKGHIALATARFPKGTTGTQLDAFARRALWQKGLDYDHGTGHGVGSYLSVHEGPQRISKAPNMQPLLPGMIVSNEPGYYKTGAYGIRIENLVAVQPDEAAARQRRARHAALRDPDPGADRPRAGRPRPARRRRDRLARRLSRAGARDDRRRWSTATPPAGWNRRPRRSVDSGYRGPQSRLNQCVRDVGAGGCDRFDQRAEHRLQTGAADPGERQHPGAGTRDAGQRPAFLVRLRPGRSRRSC